MNDNTGRIVPYDAISFLPPPGQARYVPMTVPPTQLQRLRKRVGRNDKCPCGSGKKFKHCHYRRK